MVMTEKNIAKSKVSVITVVKDDVEGLRNTYLSLKIQEFNNWEMIIVGTSSTDTTGLLASEIEQKDQRVKFFVQEPAGIYPAMNFGIDEAEGNLLWFMNAGDLFSDSYVLDNAIRSLFNSKATILIGNHKYVGDSHPRRKTRKFSYISRLRFAFSLRISHQAMLFKSECFHNNLRYDAKYRLVADSDLVLKVLKNHQALLVPDVYALVKNGGASDLNLTEVFAEKHSLRINHFGSKIVRISSRVFVIILLIKLRYLSAKA